MQDLNDKVTGNTLTAAEWNELPSEIQNVIISNGISLSTGDLSQLGKAIADYVALSNFYTCTGPADAYVLTQNVGSIESPVALTAGMSARFRPNLVNTGATTINVAGLGVKALNSEANVALSGGEISTGRDAWMRYDGTRWLLSNATAQSSLESERGAISGLMISNDASDLPHDIAIGIGNCRDSADSETITLTSILTKQIDADWVAGNDAGGIPPALTLAINTWYHVFVIRKSNGLVDAGFDTSLSAANLLAESGYDQYRRIGSVKTDGSSNILLFEQLGDDFQFHTSIGDYAVANPGTGSVQVTLSVPLGVRSIANVSGSLRPDTAVGVDAFFLFSPGPSAGQTPTNVIYDFQTFQFDSADDQGTPNSVNKKVLTDTASRIRYQITASTADITIVIITSGWTDDRGKSA